jgi:Lrp/AsnC family leucine-responsive transcriptional regulator
MKKVTLLDDVDALLLKTLSRHPRINQVELAKKLDLTQPAISLRLRKLKKMGLINDVGPRLDAKSIGLKMMKVDMQVKNGEVLREKFRSCPAVADNYMVENNSMCMILVGENTSFLNCMVAHHLKKNSDITNVSSELIIDSLHGFKTSMDTKHKLDLPPCGDGPCNKCECYIDNGGECVGCPMTKFYKGMAWR